MTRRVFFFSFFFFFPAALCQDFFTPPVYKYRYETEDVMKSAASNMPMRGYHVVEGGYYPSEELGQRGFGGNGNIGLGGILAAPSGYSGQFLSPQIAPVGVMGHQFSGQYIPRYVTGGHFLGGGIGGGAGQGAGGGGAGLGAYHHHHPHHIGGEEIAKEEFSGGKKNLNDEKYEKSEAKKGEEVNHGKSGFSKGEASAKDVKGDSGYYSNADGEKKVVEDGKEYHGGQQYQKEGKSGEEQTAKKGHKKGHKVKSFKTTHHKDESGKSEEYYDEEHDEGGNVAFKGETGSFGEKNVAAFKGGKEDAKYNSAENKKEGHYNNEHAIKKAEGDEGKFGENKFTGNQAAFGYKTGADEQSLLGHQESSKFHKSQPFVIPFYQP